MRTEDIDIVLAPKIAGAWNLHRLTADDPLEMFVLFSSISSVLGSTLQGNYAAANAFLDELALLRQSKGLAALSVNWGALGETGYVARHADAKRYLDQIGVLSMSPAEALSILELLLRQRTARAVALRMNPNNVLLSYPGASSKRLAPALQADTSTEVRERRFADSPASKILAMPVESRLQFIEDHVRQRCAKVLGTDPSKVNLDAQVTELGLDSLMAVELQSVLKLDFGVQITAAKLLQGVSIRQLSDRVLEQLQVEGPSASDATPLRAPQTRLQLPLGVEQRRFWFLGQLDPHSPAYNISMATRFSGALNVAALESAINELIVRHEALRATFGLVDGEPVQWIAPELRLHLDITDLSEFPTKQREAELQRRTAEEAGTGFDLHKGPLIRAELMRLGDADHCLLLTIHHIVIDVWSLSVIWREYGILYRTFDLGQRPVLPDLPVRYSEYITRERASLSADSETRQLSYWKERLAGLPVLELPFDRPRPARRRLHGTRRYFDFPDELWKAVEDLSRCEGATPFMTLLAAFQLLLHRYSGQDTICVGTPISRRSQIEARGLVGCFVNTLAMRTDLSGNPTFRELRSRVRETVVEAHAHQDVPFERVVEAVQPERDRSCTPIFQSLLVLHNIPFSPMALPGLTLAPTDLSSGSAVFDLILVIATEPQLKAYVEYDSDLFDASTVERIIERFRNLLDFVSHNPAHPISDIPLLDNAEQHEILRNCNGTESHDPARVTLHELVEEQVRRTPGATAVVCQEESLTYDQLNRAANRIARLLRREGVGPETIVGICAERSIEAVAGMLGILKAGGAYLPLDPAYPPERLRYMLLDAKPPVVLSSRRFAPVLTSLCDRVFFLDEEHDEDPGKINSGSAPNNLAYVIYTSGSTGEPKGVMIEHHSICNQILWRQEAFPLDRGDVVLHGTSLSFDPSVWECFGPLTAGAKVIIAPQDEGHETVHLCELIHRHHVTVLQGVPSKFRALVETAKPGQCKSVRLIFSGGEELTRELQDRIFSRFDARLINVYGATETAIEAAFHLCQREQNSQGNSPIGRPIANSQIFILDKNLQPVPPGVPGELCVGGRNVGRGYLNRPELTKEKFIASPLAGSPDGLYRTGDLARWRPDGVLEFLGRVDRQLKVRGFRIEPGEVEAALNQHPDVSVSAVKVHCPPQGGARLQAWVAPRRGTSPQAAELRTFSGKRLPRFMIPSDIFFLSALPLTPDGKTDYARLQATGRPQQPVTSLTDPLLDALAGLWEEVLPERPCALEDDFFDLGGHSLLSIQLSALIAERFRTVVPLAELLQVPTLQGMAQVLRSAGVEV
jgi:amino acid adenylation domain-containing protein